MTATATTALENAFFLTPATIAGKAIRPLSGSSLLILQRTQNALLSAPIKMNAETGVAGGFDLSEPDTLSALCAFIFIHAMPLREMMQAVRSPRAKLEAAVARFAAGLAWADLLEANQSIAEEIAAAAAATFEAEPPPSDGPVTLEDPTRRKSTWITTMIFCCVRETGWPEFFVRWELPLARLLQYEEIRLTALDFSCYDAGTKAKSREKFDNDVSRQREEWEKECDPRNLDSWLARTDEINDESPRRPTPVKNKAPVQSYDEWLTETPRF